MTPGLWALVALAAATGVAVWALHRQALRARRRSTERIRRYRLTFRCAVRGVRSQVGAIAIGDTAVRRSHLTEGELVRWHGRRLVANLEDATGLSWRVVRCEVLDAGRDVWMPKVFPLPADRVVASSALMDGPTAPPKVWP
jgi:hypothetical protein